MKKYTFIADYKGGTFISQYTADDLIEAERMWANNLSPRYISPKKVKQILAQIEEGESTPTPITGVDSVWFDLFLLYEKCLYLNIVETV